MSLLDTSLKLATASAGISCRGQAQLQGKPIHTASFFLAIISIVSTTIRCVRRVSLLSPGSSQGVSFLAPALRTASAAEAVMPQFKVHNCCSAEPPKTRKPMSPASLLHPAFHIHLSNTNEPFISEHNRPTHPPQANTLPLIVATIVPAKRAGRPLSSMPTSESKQPNVSAAARTPVREKEAGPPPRGPLHGLHPHCHRRRRQFRKRRQTQRFHRLRQTQRGQRRS